MLHSSDCLFADSVRKAKKYHQEIHCYDFYADNVEREKNKPHPHLFETHTEPNSSR